MDGTVLFELTQHEIIIRIILVNFFFLAKYFYQRIESLTRMKTLWLPS